MAEPKKSSRTKTEADLTPIVDSDSSAAQEEIEFDSLDLKVEELANTIIRQRELAFGPGSIKGIEAELFSLPVIVDKHSRRLGLTEDQFARAARSQGLEVGTLLDDVGRKGLDVKDVLSELEAGGMVSLKPLEQRKEAMKSIRSKLNVLKRKQEIKDIANQRLISGEKQYAFTDEERRTAKASKPIDFKSIKDSSKRQQAVAQVVYDMGSSAGLNQNQMAAILANGFSESRLDPFIKSPGKEDSHGVWQFNRGAGEGVGYTVEQLQDPRFQMAKILDAVHSRDELAGFRNPDADANELTNQFMTNFEKPSIQDATEQKRRQAYLKQASRLLGEAAKASPQGESLAEIDMRKRQAALDRINKADKKETYRFLLDKEAIGGDVQNEIAKPGSAAYNHYEQEVRMLTDPEVSDQPDRARMISAILAGLEKTDIKSSFENRAFQKLFEAGYQYDREIVARKMGITVGAFDAAAMVEGSREQALRDELVRANKRHVALYLTTNKLGVPALLSYEFMDPDNTMFENRVGEGDPYLTQLADAAGKNRVRIVGLDKSNRPVFTAEDTLDSVFNKLNLHLSFTAGGLRRLLDGPEGESVREALMKGSVQGIKDADDFTKLMLSREGAEDGGVKAFAYGSLGFLVDVLTPDPTVGLAKAVSTVGAGVKKLQPLLNKRFIPDALDGMGDAAGEMIETQKLVVRARDSFSAGNIDEGNKLLAQARETVKVAEDAEKTIRKKLKPLMREVDRTDHNVAMEIARDVPLLTGKGADEVASVLGFSDTGLKRDFVHPATERVLSRGEAEAQIVPFPEFLSLSRKLERLQNLATRIGKDQTSGGYAVEIQREVLAPLMTKLNNQLVRQGFTQAKKAGQSEQVRRSVMDLLSFVRSREGADLIARSPEAFEGRLVTYLSELPPGKKGSKQFNIRDLTREIGKAHDQAAKIAAKSEVQRSKADLTAELVKVTNSIAAIAESRGVAHALTRKALAEQEKIKVRPIIQSVANKYEEIGTRKISSTALNFRNQLEETFPAMRGDSAMHVARNLDQRLKAIARTTNESVEEIFERREFSDIIGRMKREAIVDQSDDAAAAAVTAVDDAARSIGIDPKVEPLKEGLELLTTKELRDAAVDPDADFISGMVFKADGENLSVKSIELPASLRGQGIGTSVYLEALKVAKTRGLGFLSDVNPNAEATKMYRRLIAAGVPFSELKTMNAATGEPLLRFVMNKNTLADFADSGLDIRKFAPSVDVPPGAAALRPAAGPEVAEFAADTQKVVRAMEEAPSVEAFILEISKVARKELDAEQMGKVTEWLSTQGIKVGHRGALFVSDDPAEIARAEDVFAKAFTAYAEGAPPPTAEITSAFERVRNRIAESFAAAKNARVDGAQFSPQPQIESVFDRILVGMPPEESGAPNIFKSIRRALLDDLPAKVSDEYLLRIAQESDRLGHPISVKELKSKLLAAHKKYLKDRQADVTIDLPGPVSLGGLLSPGAKSSYSLEEISRGYASFAARKSTVDSPATRKIATTSQADAVNELSTTEMIEQFVVTSGPVKKGAAFAFIGGDAVADMRSLPPKVREAVMAGVRMTQQSIGDAVTLIHEGVPQKLVRFITGDPQIKFKSGRNALSAGHDMMGSASQSLNKYFANVATSEQTELSKAYSVLKGLLDDQRFMSKGWEKTLENGQQTAINAVDSIVFAKGGSDLLQKIFAAGGYANGRSLDPKAFQLLETVTYSLGLTTRKGKLFDGADNSVSQFSKLYDDIHRLYGIDADVGPVANRVTALIAGYGQAAKARLEWVNLGIATDARTANNFKKWIQGEGIDDAADMAKVEQAFKVHGYNPQFLEAAELEGLNFYVPAAARRKLSMALEQATDPTQKQLTGDLFEALGQGIKEVAGGDQLAMAWTYRYLKTRMVRGHFLLKSRYFWMNTMDHFNQMGQIVGFRPALISTTRILPQTFAANPVGQGIIAVAQKFGPDDAGEAARRWLQSKGDAAADWSAKILRSSKWRGDLNDLLEARDGFMMVDGIPLAYKDLRRIGVEEGLSASFDTAALGTKIRLAGEMFLSDEMAKGANTSKLGFLTTGANPYRQMTKVAEDIAEGWSERERYGAMLTLVEMGVDPRKAARLTIDALYDYAGSMSKMDRHWLINIFFPFWAFQKNANRQLVDVVFSPRGAYRLGVLNRSYNKGSQFVSEMLFEDIVDPLGVDVQALSDEQRDAYDALKKDLVDDFGVDSISQLDDKLKRQILMAMSGRDSMFQHGKWYKLNASGAEIRRLYKKSKDGKFNYGGVLEGGALEKPSKTSLPPYYSRRDVIMSPHAANEQNRLFHTLKGRQEPDRSFTAFMFPEQSYKAAYNHFALTWSALFAIGSNLMSVAAPDYLTDAYSPDDENELMSVSKPLMDLFQPDRALLAADLFAMAKMKDNGPPYRVAGSLAKMMAKSGYEFLPVDPKEDPFRRRLEYSQAMQEVEDGKIRLEEEDPYLFGAQLKPTKNYYMSGGLGTLLLKHSPLDELNGYLKKLEMAPSEEQAEIRGQIQRWVRTFGVMDITEVYPDKTAAMGVYEQQEETGGQDFTAVKRAIGADYVDVEKKEPAPLKGDLERLERLKKRDPGSRKIDLE